MIRIDIFNDGKGTPELGNYNYTVYLPGSLPIEGRYTKYPRELGWKELVKRIVAIEEEKE